MFYPILVEYYVLFCMGLLLLTWYGRAASPTLRLNLLYLYGMIATLGFLLAQDWVAGVIFGLILLETGSSLKSWLRGKQANLK